MNYEMTETELTYSIIRLIDLKQNAENEWKWTMFMTVTSDVEM